MGFFSRHRKAFKSVIASFGMLFGLLAGCATNPIVEQEKEPENAQVMPFSSGTLNLGIDGLSASYTGDGSFSWSNNVISGNVECSKWLLGSTKKATLTFKNTSGKKAVFGFKTYCSRIEGSANAWDTSLNAGSYWEKKSVIESNETVTVSISASNQVAHDRRTDIEISNIEFSIVDTYLTNFIVPDSSGIFEVNGQALNQNQSISSPSNEPYTLKFTPSNGYIFVGWYVDGILVSNNNPFVFYASKNGENVMPIAADNSAALFSVADSIFADLEQAINRALNGSDNIVRLHKSGTLSPKADGSSYVFSKGVNLFIPGSVTSVFLDYAKPHPVEGANGGYTCDMKMQLTDGVTLEFESGSKLVIGGDMWYATGGNLTSLPVGEIGEIILSAGSAVNLRAGSEFYCWGYASGEGEIHAFNGSNVYEGFSFYFRGGTALSKIYGKAFLFNQYYVQNIECALHLHSGSTDTVSFRISYKGLFAQQYKSESFVFVGANGMFTLKENATLIKKYNREQDRMEYRVIGNGTLSHIQVTVAGNTVDSADYILPMNNNMDIVVESGKLTLEQNVEFLPEATLTVNNGATVVVGSNRTMLFYDLSNWKGKKYGSTTDIVPISYVSPHSKQSGYFKRSDATIKNGAKLVLNGEIENSGTILSTNPENTTQDVSEAAKVVSDGGGKMLFSEKTYDSNEIISTKFKQPQNNGDPVEISSKPMVFVNSDNSIYSGTCPAGSALVHENGFWNAQEQGPRTITITFKNADATDIIGTKTYTISGNTGIELPNQTEFANFQGTIFLWLREDDNTRSYEPNTNVKIQTNTVLIAFIGGWYRDLNKDDYYYDRDTGKTKGIKYIYNEGTWPEGLYCFDENGVLLKNEGQIFTYEQGTKYDNAGDGNIYYVNNGVVQNGKGFVERDATAGEGETNYYYFGPSHYAYRNTTCYINTNLNNLLPEGVYTFGNDGRVEALECSNFTRVDSVTLSADGYCTFGTIKAGIGLFASGTHIYYAKDDGSIMKNGTYYVEEGKRNGKVTEAGLYYFDTNGYLCDSLMNPITPEANA